MLVNMNFACKDVLLENDMLEKATKIKEFEYSPLGTELKAQTDIAKNNNNNNNSK